MNLITRKEMADLAGVSKPSISEAVKKRLRPACVGKDRKLRIDVEHPVAQQYIAEKRADGTTAAKHTGAKAPPASPPQAPSTNHVISLVNETGEVINLEELTVREIALKYGGVAQFSQYIKALKDIADYKNKEQAHLIKRGELIERETTAAALFMLVDIAYKRLIAEMPSAVSPQLVPLILSQGEGSTREVEQLLVDSVSKILKDCKAEVRKKLRQVTRKGGADAG